MPSVSKAQHAFMAMSQSPKGRAALRKSGKKPAPASVGTEFIKADRGKHFTVKRVKLRR
jgi:hypothetical protein